MIKALRELFAKTNNLGICFEVVPRVGMRVCVSVRLRGGRQPLLVSFLFAHKFPRMEHPAGARHWVTPPPFSVVLVVVLFSLSLPISLCCHEKAYVEPHCWL